MSSGVHPVYELIIWTRDTCRQLDAATIRDYVEHFPQYYYAWWMKLLEENPYHIVIETGLVCFIIWLMFIRRTVDPSKATKTKLTDKEVDWLVDTWVPEPLVPENDEAVDVPIVESVNGNEVRVRGVKEPVINLASNDFLGLGKLPNVRERAREALDKYGCGSCGPRGFYGTIDVHLEFEANLAKFMKAEQSICYSDGASAVSSCIPAYSKKGDLILVDEGCSEPIRTGVNLSRSTVHFFKHNDMQDLANLLETIAKDDRKYKRDPTKQRRFIVVEGLYHLTGDLCPLPEVLRLKEKFCYRVVLDESLSFGTIGKSGRGLTEYYDIKIDKVDMITVAMDTTLAGIGGGCVGTREVVDHQRLSGSGYCFSASAPPFLFAASVETLHQLEERGPDLLAALRSNIQALIAGINNLPHVHVVSSNESPILHVALDQSSTFVEDERIFDAIAKACLQRGVAVTALSFDGKLLKEMLRTNGSLQATLRLNVNASLTSSAVKKILKELKSAIIHVLGK